MSGGNSNGASSSAGGAASTSASAAAPSPDTDFGAFVDNMKAALEEVTANAAELPDKSDLMFHRTLDRKFAKGMDSSSERVLSFADQILQLSHEAQPRNANAPRTRARRKLGDEDDVVDRFHGAVVETVDGLLEDADLKLDECNGERKKAAIDLNPSAGAMRNLPGPPKETTTPLPMELRNNKMINKPQLLFKDPVNNSLDAPPWKPTLKEKAHAMVPLGFVVTSEDDVPMDIDDTKHDDDPKAAARAAARRERLIKAKKHPYYYETRHISYPTALFTSTEPIPPKPYKDTPFEFVDTPEQLETLTEALLQASEIAFDLEHHDMRSYRGFTCLMQVSTRDADWIVDTLALRAELREHKLGGVLADPSIVFHGADSDIVWLQRDFDIYVVNLFDTYHATKVLEFPQASLKSLLQLYCDVNPDKKYQMADWRTRPLPKEMLQYARSDTHYLLYIFDKLRNELINRSSRQPSPVTDDGTSTPKPNPQRAMRRVLELSAETALKLYDDSSYDRETGMGQGGWLNLAKKFVKGKKKDFLQTKEGIVFTRLHSWRDDLARELDESPHYVVKNQTIIRLAEVCPTTVAGVSRIASGKGQRYAEEMTNVIKQACADFKNKDSKPSPLQRGQSQAKRDVAVSAPAPQRQVPTEARSTKRAKVEQTSVDIWANMNGGPPQATSALFGSTMVQRPVAPPTVPGSSLFGNTFATSQAQSKQRSVRQQSPGFQAVQMSIHTALEPPPADPARESAEAHTSPQSPVRPEAVAFVPADKRKNQASDRASTTAPTSKSATNSDATADAPPATKASAAVVDADGVVSVKRKKGKKDKVKESDAQASQSASPSADGPSREGTSKRSKKAKVNPEDIPDFDYSAEPSLLDKPTGSTKPVKKKGVKGKGKGDAKKSNDASAFRRPPSDPSQPKSGNKSGTFAG